MTTDVDPTSTPSGAGCLDCERAGGWWLHLRRCAACGHVGCCDNSPSRHATGHAEHTGHPVVTSFEPGEDWFYDYRSARLTAGPHLAGPRHHPADQPAPGPAGRVPRDWQTRLNP
ncbi:UBP-type zinc finger domain-containing protein [Mycobacterium hodleri]|uniref:UBP-type zinc finger domain-containing protein n=1 Tax=Mycolicibacterium hodleri TaxID=49897 RepID=UPI0021F37B42|nr:UBP-type zinc finger domain-containing protein [Mycolicibacterium hodleri]MCV7133438.1 UBP-type zinc finger domain-containing protein [Mycolicibacterium hodleri]